MPLTKKRHESDSEDNLGFITPKKNKRKKSSDKSVLEYKSLFGKLMNKSGAILRTGMANLLDCDQAVFQQNLRKNLKSHSAFSDEVIQEFITGLQEHVEDNDKFKWTLLYCQTSPTCEVARGIQQDSLIRLMLNIDELQPKVISLLMDKFLSVIYDNSLDGRVDFPRLILGSFRWLDHIVDKEALTSMIKDFIDASPLEIQKEIIEFIPDILDDAGQLEISKTLFRLYDTIPDLTTAVLDTLSCMTLPQEKISEIHHNVLKSLHAVMGCNLPIVVNFLLHHTQPSLAQQILSDFREKLHLPGDTSASFTLTQQKRKRSPKASQNQARIKEYSDFEMLLFSKIKSAILIFRYLPVSWLKVINDVSDIKEFKSLDLLMLILLYEVVPSRRKPIESILRNKIRLGLSSNTFLKSLFANHSAFLKEYFDTLQKIIATLTRSSEPRICDFGIAMYRYAFISLDSYRRELISSMLAHLCDNSNIKLATLSLLSDLAHKHTEMMTRYTIFLKGALDVIDLLNVREAKLLMDAIIHLAHAEKQSSLESELAILVKKQLSHTDIKYKRLGVLSAVLTLKNLSNNNNSSSNLDESGISEPDENSLLGQQNQLFQMVCKCTQSSPSACALFYDELASNILKNGFDKQFEKLIDEKMLTEFEGTFVIEDKEVMSSDFLPVSCQYNLEDEEKSDIALNLAPMVFQALDKTSKQDATSMEFSVYILAPHFRLLRMMESHLNDGDLTNIDALLGCSIVSPVPRVYEEFSSFATDKQHAALSFLFHLINWFRELISAFGMQKDKELKCKAIKRLRQIVDLQALLSKLLPLCPTYVPPAAVFDYDLSVPVKKMISAPPPAKPKKAKQPLKKGQKKRKKGGDPEPTPNSPSGESQSQVDLQPTIPSSSASQVKSKSAGTIDLTLFRPHFRELHLDVFNLLFGSSTFESSVSDTSTALTMPEAEFLLSDLNAKLSRAFDAGSKRTTVLGKSSAERDIGFSYLDLFDYPTIADQSHRFIKPICVHLENIGIYFQNLIDSNDGIEDSPNMYTDETAPIMRVNTLLFTTLKIFFSCPNLLLPQHEPILIGALTVIAKKLTGDKEVSQKGKDFMINSTFNYISKFQNSIINMDTAVAQIQALQGILSLDCEPSVLKGLLVKDILHYLQKEWYTMGAAKEKGSHHSRNVEILLVILLLHCDTPLETILDFTTHGFKEIYKGNDYSDKYPTLNKNTLLVYYKSLFENLVKGIRKEISSCSALSEVSGNQKRLTIWHSGIKMFAEFVNILKIFNTSSMLASCLKHSNGFLDLFLSLGMPLLDKCLHSDRQEVVMLIKNLQISTRFLQNACTHSKVKQDLKLIRFVPPLKRSLESIIYRVKAMLVLNEASEAFWMGNLKNRDLHGEEILTQKVQEDQSDEDQAADEEAPESDVDLGEDNDSVSKKNEEEDSNYDESI